MRAVGQQGAPKRSPITTHVLDTSVGRPAAGVGIQLARRCPGSGQAWAGVAKGVTNADGRVGDLLPPSDAVEPGLYRRASVLALPLPFARCGFIQGHRTGMSWHASNQRTMPVRP